jgi:phage shock protein E
MLHKNIKSVKKPEEVAELIKSGAFILDIRSNFEAKRGMAKGAVNIPFLKLKSNFEQLPKEKTIIVYCGTGGRADKALNILHKSGFDAVNGGGYKGIVKILEETDL